MDAKLPDAKKKKLKEEIQENMQEMFEQLSELRINKKQIDQIVQKLKELVVRIEKGENEIKEVESQDRLVAEGSAQDVEGDEVVAAEVARPRQEARLERRKSSKKPTSTSATRRRRSSASRTRPS